MRPRPTRSALLPPRHWELQDLIPHLYCRCLHSRKHSSTVVPQIRWMRYCRTLLIAPPAQAALTACRAPASGATASGMLQIGSTAPGLFTANGNGAGAAAATAVRVNSDNSQSPVNVFQCGTTALSCTPTAIDVSGGAVYLTLYGTGIRNRSSLANVTVSIGGVEAPVLFAGAQGGFVGLDQVNVQVPTSLRGRGSVNIVLTVDGKTANTVTINVQ